MPAIESPSRSGCATVRYGLRSGYGSRAQSGSTTWSANSSCPLDTARSAPWSTASPGASPGAARSRTNARSARSRKGCRERVARLLDGRPRPGAADQQHASVLRCVGPARHGQGERAMSWCHVHGKERSPGCPECWEPEAPLVPRTSNLGDPLRGTKADAGYPPHNSSPDTTSHLWQPHLFDAGTGAELEN